MNRVSIIPPAVLDVVEDDFKLLIQSAIDRSGGRQTFKSVRDSVAEGRYQLWMAFDEMNSPIGALVTQIEFYPGRKMLNYLFIGGRELVDWHIEMLDSLERFAKEQECDGMELVGRVGWERYMRKFGWGASHVVIERMFEDDEEEEKQDAA
jgi:hypothetical protein